MESVMSIYDGAPEPLTDAAMQRQQESPGVNILRAAQELAMKLHSDTVGLWKQRAERLWELLERIEEINEERGQPHDPARVMSRRVARKRHALAESREGYTLEWK